MSRLIDTHAHPDFIVRRWKKINPGSKLIKFSEFRQIHGNEFSSNFEGFVSVFCRPDTWNEVGHIFVTLLER